MTGLKPAYLNGLNQDQAAAVEAPLHGGVKVLAGAGTGKTRLIAHRFVKLMDDMAKAGIERPEEKILAVTFTVKAAGEMKGRINELLGDMGHEPLSPDVWISNFHSVCKRIIQRHALSLELSPDFSIVGDLEQQLVFRRLITGIAQGRYDHMGQVIEGFDLTPLSPEGLSLSALEALPIEGLSDLLEKLPDLVRKIKASGFSPREFYQIAHRQTDQLTELLKTMPSTTAETGQLYEYHQDYAVAWDKHLNDLKDNRWSFLGTSDERDRFLIAKGYDLTDHEPFYRERLRWLYSYGWFVSYNGRKKNDPFSQGTADFSELDRLTALEHQLIDVLTLFYALYQYQLRQEYCLDFDDLINETIVLFRNHPAVRKTYQEQFEALIVDEFQDSNGSQLELLRLLMRDDVDNITVVGDEKQSIYGFRYAQPENLDLIFQKQAPRTVHLSHNYRSVPTVLHMANHLTAMMTDDPKQQLQSGLLGSDEEKHARKTEKDACVQWITLGKTEVKIVHDKDGNPKEQEKPEPIASVQEREALYIATEASRLIREEGYTPQDIVILVKRHTKAERIQTALQEVGLFGVKEKSKAFFEQSIIQAAMAVLRLMRSCHDDRALTCLLQARLNHRSLKELSSLRDKLELKSLYEVLMFLSLHPENRDVLSSDVWDVLESLLQIIHMDREKKEGTIARFLSLIDTLGVRYLYPHKIRPEDADELLRTFKYLLLSLHPNTPLQPTLAETIETLEYYQAHRNIDLPVDTVMAPNGHENSIEIMTIHAAKGLERPVVFVAYAETDSQATYGDTSILFDPQYPGKLGFGLMLGKHDEDDTLKKKIYQTLWEKPRGMHEEQRLFYVALTRAMKKLYVFRAQKTADWTQAPLKNTEALQVFEEDNPKDLERLEQHFKHAQPLEVSKKRESNFEEPLQVTAFHGHHHHVRTLDLPLSFSALGVFMDCPVRYDLQYQWKLPQPEPEQTESQAAQRGNVIHALLHKHYLYEGCIPDSVMELVLSQIQGDEHHWVRTVYQHFCASPYSYASLRQQGFQIFSEQPLEFLLPLEDASGESIVMTAVVDVLLYNQEKRTYGLIDFKTGHRLTPQKINRYAQQLALYRRGILSLRSLDSSQLPVANVWLVHLTSSGIVQVPLGEIENERGSTRINYSITTAIHQLLEQLGQAELPEKPVLVNCQSLHCPYIPVCPKSNG